jgi:hypothetical protein
MTRKAIASVAALLSFGALIVHYKNIRFVDNGNFDMKSRALATTQVWTAFGFMGILMACICEIVTVVDPASVVDFDDR